MDMTSDDIETAVSKPKRSRASPRPKSASKKSRSSSAKGSPYKGKGASGASTSSKTARELWLSAVQGGNGIGSSQKKGSLGKRTPTEVWTDTLRATGYGLTQGTDSFSGLSKNQSNSMSYGSTSHYLRQRAGTEKPGRSHDYTASGKATPGTPAYKSREEYYDEVLALKKQIQAMNNDNATQKAKIRRLEEDNIKKEKEMGQLLDPSKSEDLRRTLSDRRPDSSTVIHSMKQKILKLEHQLKEKETAYNKLQSDLKTTKVEEMKVQMETFYKEIIRLNQIKSSSHDSPISRTVSPSVKETPSRLKALQDTIKRMNEKNVRLMSENKTLKEDLEKMMEDKASSKEKQRHYEDMNKKDLLSAVTKLEKRLDRAETDNFSIVSDVDSRRDTEGKMVLEGTVAQRLDQLDKRETELLEEIAKQKNIIKRLKEDRVHYRKKTDEKDKEIKALKKEIEELQAELDSFYDKHKLPTPRRTPREKHGTKQRGSSDDEERMIKANKMRETLAAKRIQSQWRDHYGRQVEATELIQGAIRGHKSRQGNMTRMRGYMAEPDDNMSVEGTATVTESELEDAADQLQTNFRGYQYRKKQIKKKGSWSPRSRVSPTRRLDSEGEEVDDETPPTSARKMSGRSTPPNKYGGSGRNTPTNRFNSSGRSTPVGRVPQGRTTPKQHGTFGRRTPVFDDSESDDDIVIPTSKRGRP